MKLSEKELEQLQVLEADANDIQELLKAKIVFNLVNKIRTAKYELEHLKLRYEELKRSTLYPETEAKFKDNIEYNRGYINAMIEVAKLLGADG